MNLSSGSPLHLPLLYHFAHMKRKDLVTSNTDISHVLLLLLDILLFQKKKRNLDEVLLRFFR